MSVYTYYIAAYYLKCILWMWSQLLLPWEHQSYNDLAFFVKIKYSCFIRVWFHITLSRSQSQTLGILLSSALKSWHIIINISTFCFSLSVYVSVYGRLSLILIKLCLLKYNIHPRWCCCLKTAALTEFSSKNHSTLVLMFTAS